MILVLQPKVRVFENPSPKVADRIEWLVWNRSLILSQTAQRKWWSPNKFRVYSSACLYTAPLRIFPHCCIPWYLVVLNQIYLADACCVIRPILPLFPALLPKQCSLGIRGRGKHTHYIWTPGGDAALTDDLTAGGEDGVSFVHPMGEIFLQPLAGGT